MCLTRNLKRWRTAKNRFLVKMSIKDHTSGLSESNFDHTHRQKAIFMKQFTWQLMCKKFKKP